MIDIHTHILPCVDDGSKSDEQSFEMLKAASEAGVDNIICTPHRRGNVNKTSEEIEVAFEAFKRKAEPLFPVKLYLGREVYVERDYRSVLKENPDLCLCNSKFILLEFNYTVRCDISEVVYEVVNLGLRPIVAHFERYSYADLDQAYYIKNSGGFIQVNAEAVVRGFSPFSHKLIKKMFKEGFVDFVASDVHYGRPYMLAEAEKIVRKKVGNDAADVVFEINAKQILKG